VHKSFEYGTWGGEIRPEFEPKSGDIVATKHWCSSGFASTDLDLQLKKHGIHQLIVMGLIAHTCVEATVRYAAELGYEVTLVKDATEVIDECRHRGIAIIGTATTVDEAIALEEAGVDVVAASGFEAGGHRGSLRSSQTQPKSS
jgi:nicotinamidase-related amidase